MLWRKRGSIEKHEPVGEMTEVQKDMTNRVLIRVQKEGRNVTVKVNSRLDGTLLFNCEYITDESDRPAHYTAESIAKEFVRSQGLYADQTLSNVELPVVRTLRKRSR